MHSEQQNVLPVGCVLLAAGDARRFGGDKLSALLGGQTLLERALRAVPAEELSHVAVVVQGNQSAAGGQNPQKIGQCSEIDSTNGGDWQESLIRRFGFSIVRNCHPDWGVSYSVRLGTAALMDRCQAIVYQTADQPLLRRDSVRELVRFWRRNPTKIAALSHEGVRGSPCVFPARFYRELLELEGDRGGSAVIRRHMEDLILWEVPAMELADADTPEELARLRAVAEL